MCDLVAKVLIPDNLDNAEVLDCYRAHIFAFNYLNDNPYGPVEQLKKIMKD